MTINADVTGVKLVLPDDAPMGATPLANPGYIPYAESIKIPNDGSNYGQKIGDAIANAKLHSRTRFIIREGMVNAEVPIPIPANMTVEGDGTADTLTSTTTYVGGTKILQPTTGGDVFTAIGTDTGNSLTGMLANITLKNLAVCARVGFSQAVANGGPGTLYNFQFGIKHIFENVSANGYLARHFMFRGVWDSEYDGLKSLTGGGFSDMTVTADSSTVQGYSGRTFTGIELSQARSFGVPAVEIHSPNQINGDDTSNNLRFTNFHIESNACNGVPLFIHGGNGVMITFEHGKIEATEGNVPLIVCSDQNSFRYRASWLYAGAGGAVPATFGGQTAGTLYNTKTTAAMVLLGSCYHPEIDATVGWSSGGNLFSVVTCFTSKKNDGTTNDSNPTDDPAINIMIEAGLEKVTGRAIQLSACTQVNRNKIHVNMPPYAQAVSGANTGKVNATSGTAFVGTPTTKPSRNVTGTTATDTPTADDMGGIVHYKGTVPVTVTANDLGAGTELVLAQDSAAAVITVVAGSGVTLQPTNAVLVSKGQGKTINLRSNGDGTVTVNNNGVLAGIKTYDYDGGDTGATFNFTPSPDASLWLVWLQAPGGGSGAGGRFVSSTGGSGGAGGAAGGKSKMRITKAQMTAALATLGTSSIAIVIGAPGTAGVAAAADSTNGGDGGSAGNITFGSMAAFGQNFQAGGGGGGQGGRSGTLSVGGSSSSHGPVSAPAVASGTSATSPTGQGIAGGAGNFPSSNAQSETVGGSGGGSAAIGTSFVGGGSQGAGGGASGGGISTAGAGNVGNQGGFGEGGFGGAAGTQSSPAGASPTNTMAHQSGPGGGGGYGAESTKTAGAGGRGVNGSGAGGGGSTINGQTAGAGAIGGTGFAYIEEYYANF